MNVHGIRESHGRFREHLSLFLLLCHGHVLCPRPGHILMVNVIFGALYFLLGVGPVGSHAVGFDRFKECFF